MRAARPFGPQVIRPRRLRKLIIITFIGSVALGITTLYLVKRLRDQPFERAADRRAKIAEARYVAKRYGNEGFPAWVVDHPEYSCPQRLAELDVYVGRHDTMDPWGLTYLGHCVDGGQLRVISAGPDRMFNTFDDIVEGAR